MLPIYNTLSIFHMTHLQVLLAAITAWAIWIPAAALQAAARGETGVISILPIFPVVPLAIWGVAFLASKYGVTSIPAVLVFIHLVLLFALLVSIARSTLVLRQRKRAKNAA